MSWYKNLICSLQIPASGAVASVLKQAVATGLFPKGISQANLLDASITEDVGRWFATKLSPWFIGLTVNLGNTSEKEVVISSEYIEKVNQILVALNVARSYYATASEGAILTSLKSVAQLKAIICEELEKAVAAAYKMTLESNGYSVGEASVQTEASSYQGTTPEAFKWGKTTLAYHKIFTAVEGEAAQQETQCPQPGKQSKDYLPWVIAGAFGLIAWTAAASKKEK